jgi:hypothetical protein
MRGHLGVGRPVIRLLSPVTQLAVGMWVCLYRNEKRLPLNEIFTV